MLNHWKDILLLIWEHHKNHRATRQHQINAMNEDHFSTSDTIPVQEIASEIKPLSIHSIVDAAREDISKVFKFKSNTSDFKTDFEKKTALGDDKRMLIGQNSDQTLQTAAWNTMRPFQINESYPSLASVCSLKSNKTFGKHIIAEGDVGNDNY